MTIIFSCSSTLQTMFLRLLLYIVYYHGLSFSFANSQIALKMDKHKLIDKVK